MELDSPRVDIENAVHGAAAWFQKTAIHGFEWRSIEGDKKLVPKEGALLLWSRYYEIGSNKPIFGDRDRSIHFEVAEISSERRNGYSWYNHAPSAVLKEYEHWSQAHRMVR